MSWLAGVGILQLHCLAQTRPHRPLIWLDSGHSCGSLPEIEAASDPVALSLDIRVSRPWDPLGLLTIRINMDVEDRWRSRRRRSKVLSLVLPTRGTFLRLQLRGRFVTQKAPPCCRHAHTPQQVPVVPLCTENQRSYLSIHGGLYLGNDSRAYLSSHYLAWATINSMRL